MPVFYSIVRTFVTPPFSGGKPGNPRKSPANTFFLQEKYGKKKENYGVS